MIVYRLCKSIYANDLSGKGAEICGGRWNSPGIAMVYTSQSRALCTTEIAVHTPLGNVPSDYQLVSIDIPDEVAFESIYPSALDSNWRKFPHIFSTEEIGNSFVKKGNHAVLKVPSAVIQGEFNFLLNPAHPDFKKISITLVEGFDFDERLFNR